jgi:hypothetical protein
LNLVDILEKKIIATLQHFNQQLKDNLRKKYELWLLSKNLPLRSSDIEQLAVFAEGIGSTPKKIPENN